MLVKHLCLLLAGRWWLVCNRRLFGRRARPAVFAIANESEIPNMNAFSPRSRRSMTLRHTACTALQMPGCCHCFADCSLLVVALLAISAQFAFRIPISPVPVTGQTLVVLMIGMAYGSRLGAATVLAYLLEGGMGLPVFANGAAGWPVLIGPTGGYLVGFAAAAYVLGLLAERGFGRGPVSTALAMFVGTAVIYLFGAVWLGQFLGFEKAVTVGVQPSVWRCAQLIVAAGLGPWHGAVCVCCPVPKDDAA